MSFVVKLEAGKSEVAELEEIKNTNEVDREIANLDEAKFALLSRNHKISGLLDSLLDSYSQLSTNLAGFKAKKRQLDESLLTYQDDLPIEETGWADKIMAVKEELKRELPNLDLRFSGGKKGTKSNRELAVEKITAYLEALKTEIDNLEKIKEAKYLQTPAGQEQSRVEAENREQCRLEVLADLPPLDSLEKISQLKISPRHLELAGVYGVELTQAIILSAWKKMATDLLLDYNFADARDQIQDWQKVQSVLEDFRNNDDKFNELKESVVGLKTLKDQMVLTLADIIAENPEVKQKFHNYGVIGASLNSDLKKTLTAYDDLPEDKVADSPAALAYEYLHHVLHISTGVDSDQKNPLSNFESLFGAQNFGQKYNHADFGLAHRAEHNPEFLLQFSSRLEKLVATLQAEIKSAGKDIDPKMFLARFGQENYGRLKALPSLSAPEAKIADFPKKYVELDGSWSQKYYEDEAVFNKFEAHRKQAEEKIDLLLPLRWLEEELKQKYQKNAEVWEILDDKVKLLNYLKFLEKNKDYHVDQLIEIDTTPDGEIVLLDSTNHQAEVDKQQEYQELEEEYRTYLKNEIASIISEINRTEKKLFNKKETLNTLDKRLGTCQALSSHELADRIFGWIDDSNSRLFKESSLTPAELQKINDFVDQGRNNLKAQKKYQHQSELAERDLNRYHDKLSAKFLADYPDLMSGIFTYENLISSLKLMNIALSSSLKEKDSTLVRDFGEKSKQYRDLINDYNRKYSRERDQHIISAINFREDLAAYL